jgi:uncharacterized membrane protein YqjE
MATSASQPRTSTLTHLAGLLRSMLRYLLARLSLAGLEAKEAGAHYGIAAGLLVAGLFVAVLGYVFLVTTAVFGIAAAFDGRHVWIWVMAGAALLHIGGAVALIVCGVRRMRTGAFSSTIAEFQKDKEWLNHLANNR